MNNCDLEKFCVSGGKLHPAFTPQVTDYTVTVESNVNKVTLDLVTSDCGATYSIVSTFLQILVNLVRFNMKSNLFLSYISALW